MAATRTKPPTKRQLIADAQVAALDGRWTDAIEINDQIVNRFPREAEALNRKGRALLELRQLTAAWDAYTEALKADPANMIARRNLQRLEMLHARSDGSPEGEGKTQSSIPNTAVFIEEVGKTWVDELANPAELGVLAEVSPGEVLHLAIKVDKKKGDKITISSDASVLLGEVDARIADRIIPLINAGNRYEVYALGVSRESLRVIIREVLRDPALADRISFPRQTRGTQELMRERELLFQRDEADFQIGDDDELEGDEAIEPDVDTDAEELEEPDQDARDFVDESNLDDENRNDM